MRYIGLDLTDPYAARPRPVDVAILDDRGRCTFQLLPAAAAEQMGEWLAPVTSGPASGDILVIDGPLALAEPGGRMRDCERALGAPGKTPDILPAPRSKPFAGYVRGSVELALILQRQGWLPLGAGVSLAAATMLEAYPGGTWTRLAGRRLSRKTLKAGIQEREALLSRGGVQFAREPRTHDELDAAVCAWLGWNRLDPTRVTTVGRPSFMAADYVREGVILQAVSAMSPAIGVSDP